MDMEPSFKTVPTARLESAGIIYAYLERDADGGPADEWDFTAESTPFKSPLAREDVTAPGSKEHGSSVARSQQLPETSTTNTTPVTAPSKAFELSHFDDFFKSPNVVTDSDATQMHINSEVIPEVAVQPANYQPEHRKPRRLRSALGVSAAGFLMAATGAAVAHTMWPVIHNNPEQSQDRTQAPTPLPAEAASSHPNVPIAPTVTETIIKVPSASSTTEVKVVMAGYGSSSSAPYNKLPIIPSSVSSLPTLENPPSPLPSNSTEAPSPTTTPTETMPSTSSPTAPISNTLTPTGTESSSSVFSTLAPPTSASSS